MDACDGLNLSMFRAYDIRTPASRLSAELAARLARAVAAYFRDTLAVSGVVIAHDARSTGPAYLSLAADIYRQAGLDVLYLPGVCSTSYFYHAASRFPQFAAVMFGASHNPAGDTGQKLLGPNVTPLAEGIGPAGGLDRIKELYLANQGSPSHHRGSIRAIDLTEDYLTQSMALAGVKQGGLARLHLLQDYLFGAAGREMMLAFDRAGASLTPLHYAADGSFPLGDPNPVKQAVIRPGLDALRAGDHTLGMFFDGDGDRLDVYRGDGTYISSSFVYAAILPEIRNRFPGPGRRVFADLKCNPLALIEMSRAGLAVDVIRNGHSQIKESLIRDPATIGAVEESAHFYEAFSHGGNTRYCTENTLYLALLIARVWHQEPARFERLINIQATTAREREWGYKFPTDQACLEALAAVRAHFEHQGAAALDRMRNGMDLDATLLRAGLGFDIDEHSKLDADWLQLSQRVSQSEDALARWEAVGARPEIVADAKQTVAQIVARFGAGQEYQG